MGITDTLILSLEIVRMETKERLHRMSGDNRHLILQAHSTTAVPIITGYSTAATLYITSLFNRSKYTLHTLHALHTITSH